MRILVVEDQENLAKLLKVGLETEGFAVDCVFDGETASTRIKNLHGEYDLIILDLMLPRKGGIEICQEARKNQIATPILMLTSKSDAKDVASGLNAGADDYLAKPFLLEELIARIRAVLRRPEKTLPVKLQAKDIVLNPITKEVFKDGREVNLTRKEFSLLEFFMRNIDQVVSREQIMSNVWDFAFDSLANVVDVHVANLRKKIGDENGAIIETVRGAGYIVRK